MQKHRQTTTADSSTMGMEEANGHHIPCIEEQGKVFQQDVAVMRDTLREEVVPPSIDAMSRAVPLSSVQKVKLPRV